MHKLSSLIVDLSENVLFYTVVYIEFNSNETCLHAKTREILLEPLSRQNAKYFEHEIMQKSCTGFKARVTLLAQIRVR